VQGINALQHLLNRSTLLPAFSEDVPVLEIYEVTPSSTVPVPPQANWVTNATLLWNHRRLLARVTGIALILSAVFAFFLLPKQYDSVARLMPPDQQGGGGAALLAAVAGRSLGGLGSLGSLAGSLLGGKTSTSLYIDLLRSRTVSDHIIDRFNLQRIYHKRYRIDTVKYLARHTTVVDDKKSGVITLTFTDTDPVRARAIAQAYLEELNKTLTTSNTSSARREREFIEKRLVTVKVQLHDAEEALSQFSSVNTTLDIKEQTHAMVDAAAKLQAELIVEQSELESIEQIYGDENVRVRATRARVASLQHELDKLGGSSAELSTDTGKSVSEQDNNSLYPSLRQLPRLAVPYAALYRNTRIQETVFELLSQQYEMSRIEEAKDTPVVSVFDPPSFPEKKSFPPRLLVILVLTLLVNIAVAFLVIMRHRWSQVGESDPRRLLAEQIEASVRSHLSKRPGGSR
jgi:capsule polysaccharide export protein KpsE/RkpR